jgi:hypothetical protein
MQKNYPEISEPPSIGGQGGGDVEAVLEELR